MTLGLGEAGRWGSCRPTAEKKKNLPLVLVSYRNLSLVAVLQAAPVSSTPPAAHWASLHASETVSGNTNSSWYPEIQNWEKQTTRQKPQAHHYVAFDRLSD